MSKRFVTTMFGGIAVALPLCAAAQTLQVPHTFAGGTPALADQVNENFAAIAARLPNTGRIFIPPKSIDANLQAADRNVALGIGDSFTAAFGRPSDYVPGVAPDITVRPLFSGCVGLNVLIGVETDFRNIGPNADNVEPRVAQEFTMPTEATTIETRMYTRTALGDVNYVTVDRALAAANACAVDFNFHGILIDYPR